MIRKFESNRTIRTPLRQTQTLVIELAFAWITSIRFSDGLFTNFETTAPDAELSVRSGGRFRSAGTTSGSGLIVGVP